MPEKCVKLENSTRNPQEENSRLKEKLKVLKQIISEKLLVLNNLKYQNSDKCEKLIFPNLKLNDCKDVLNTNYDKFDKRTEEVFKQFKTLSEYQQLQIQCTLIKYTNSKLETTLQNYKMQSNILLRKIERSNTKLQFLRFTLKNKDNEQPFLNDKPSEIDEIKNRNKEIQKKLEINNQQIMTTKTKNNKLIENVSELCSKIDMATKMLNEKQHIFICELCKVEIEKTNLEAILNTKKQTAKQLDVELSNITEMITKEKESAYKLNKSIKELQSDQNIQICLTNDEMLKNSIDNPNVTTALNKFCAEVL